jgi:hypothetical protein
MLTYGVEWLSVLYRTYSTIPAPFDAKSMDAGTLDF